MSKKNVVVNEFFNSIDSEIKAYLLGFYAADGYLYLDKTRNTLNYRIGIQNSIDDLEVLELFKEYITPDSNIILIDKTDIRKAQGHLRWSSKEIYLRLTELGLGVRKTINFDFSIQTIAEDLRRHFIRGYFDGDGSFSDKNIRISTNTISFTEELLLEFKKLSPNIDGIIYNTKGKTCDFFSLRLNFNRKKQECMKLIYNYFYKDSNFYLKRKELQINDYINTVLTPGKKRPEVV